MKRILILLTVIPILYSSCKTLPELDPGQRETHISIQSDPFVYIDLEFHPYLMEQLLLSFPEMDSRVNDMIEKSHSLVAGQINGVWQIELLGNYPLGSLAWVLKRNQGWERIELEGEKFFLNRGMAVLIGARSILVYQTEDYNNQYMTFQIHRRMDQYASLMMNLERQSMGEFQSSPALQNLATAMYVNSYPQNDQTRSLSIELHSEDGRERALNGASRVFLLSMIGPSLMDSPVEIESGMVYFTDIPLTQEKWEEILNQIMEVGP